RQRIRDLAPQRPEAEGPSLRPLFQVVPASSDPASGRPVDLVPGSAGALGARILIEWGRVIDGSPRPLPMTGATVHAGDRLYVALRNHDEADVYVSLLHEDVSSQVSVITSFDPSGIPVPPGGECVVGRDDLNGQLIGMPLVWPPHADRGGPGR